MEKLTKIEIKNMPSGPKIDRFISENIFNTKWIKPTHGTCCTCQTCGWDYDNCMCGWSIYLEKAWSILEKMGGSFLVDSSAPQLGIDVTIFYDGGARYSTGTAETFELAVCRAALLTLL